MDRDIKSLINGYRNRVFQENLPYVEASKILVELSALLGNINEEIRARHKEWIAHLSTTLMANPRWGVERAKIIASGGGQWLALEEARAYKEVALEMLRALKYYLRTGQEEYIAARNL